MKAFFILHYLKFFFKIATLKGEKDMYKNYVYTHLRTLNKKHDHKILNPGFKKIYNPNKFYQVKRFGQLTAIEKFWERVYYA